MYEGHTNDYLNSPSLIITYDRRPLVGCPALHGHTALIFGHMHRLSYEAHLKKDTQSPMADWTHKNCPTPHICGSEFQDQALAVINAMDPRPFARPAGRLASLFSTPTFPSTTGEPSTDTLRTTKTRQTCATQHDIIDTIR
jgi:hypothetical protein